MDVNVSAMCYLASSCAPFLFSAKECESYIILCLPKSVHCIFLHSVFGLFQSCKSKETGEMNCF